MDTPRTHRLDEELGDLWFRRDSLDEEGWNRLYKIVRAALINFTPSHLSGLRENREIYVNDFFTDKVLPPSALRRPIHVGGLRNIYINFLKDQLRKVKTQKKYFSSATDDDPDGDGEEDFEPSNSVEEVGEASTLELLEDAGLTLEVAVESARKWLGSGEPWVPAYLAFHFCPESEKKEALRSVAQRLKIKSYHYKAAELGINWGNDKSGNTGRGFSDTLLGKWVSNDLGIKIVPENVGVIRAIFKILCSEALDY